MTAGLFSLLVLCIAAVAASPVKRYGGSPGTGAFSVSREEIEKAFGTLPKPTIRAFLKQMNDKIKDAAVMAEKMRKIKEPIREDMTVDPELMKESGFLMEDASEMSDVFNSLPPLKEEDMHFLQICIARAEETDFDQFTDRRSLMNEVLRQVISCSAIGISLMESETNLDHLTDEELTVDEVVNMFQKVQQMSIEFLHLGGFVFQFTRRISNDFGNVSNNELVHGKDENREGQTTASVVDDVSRPMNGQDTTPQTISAQDPKNQQDEQLREAVQELKRLFDSGKLKSIKDKVKGKIPDKIVNFVSNKVSGKSKGEKQKDSSRSDDNKGTNSKSAKLGSLKKKIKNLFDFSDKKSSADADKTNDKVSRENSTEESQSDDELDKRQLLDLLKIFAKRQEVLKREHVIS